MMTGSPLDEAIADAKAVRATAIANARQALEEAFSGRFAEMFGGKTKRSDPLSGRNIVVHILKD